VRLIDEHLVKASDLLTELAVDPTLNHAARESAAETENRLVKTTLALIDLRNKISEDKEIAFPALPDEVA
jgi:hypothetical protein